MNQRLRIFYTGSQKALMSKRWKQSPTLGGHAVFDIELPKTDSEHAGGMHISLRCTNERGKCDVAGVLFGTSSLGHGTG